MGEGGVPHKQAANIPQKVQNGGIWQTAPQKHSERGELGVRKSLRAAFLG